MQQNLIERLKILSPYGTNRLQPTKTGIFYSRVLGAVVFYQGIYPPIA